MTNYAGDYGGGKRLTCILREGNLTVTTTGTIYAAGTNKLPSFAFASELSKGDYVGLDIDTGNTFAATKGNPVVAVAAAAEPILGRIVTEPRWHTAPSSSQSTWATMLSGGYFRVAVVEFPTVTHVHAALVEGTTDVEVGAPLKWDLSEDAYVDAGTTFTGAFSFHYQESATAAHCLVGFGHFAATSGADDTAGIDVIA